MAQRTLVLGGTRSGKSAHAEGLVPADTAVTYVATAADYPDDREWQDRIAAHRARRPDCWTTVHAGAELPALLAAARAGDPPLLVDDLATWQTGVLDAADAWDGAAPAMELAAQQRARLRAAVAGCPARLVLVSAEVGLGVVPPTRSGRLFRDELGTLNAELAEVCDEVLLLVAGIALRLR